MRDVQVKTEGGAYLRNGSVIVSSLNLYSYRGGDVRIEVKTSRGRIATGFIRVPEKDFLEFCWQCLISADEITQYEREQAQSKTALEVIALSGKSFRDGYDDEFFEITDVAEEEK